jgi:hypothetical protein
LFSIYGFLRGAVAQLIALVGWIAGLWASLSAEHWLGVYWHAADPAIVYLVLRWIVALLAGLAVVSLFHWWAESLGRVVRSGPAGWVDRGGGLGVGAFLGFVTVALAMMVSLLLPAPRALSREVGQARTAEPLIGSAAEACSLSAGWLPGGPWLAQRFHKAHRRILVVRAGEAKAKS